MSFATWIAAVSGKRTVWLYEITVDGTTTYLSRGRDYTLSAQLYTGTHASNSKIVVTQDAQKAEVVLVFARTDALAIAIRDNDTSDVLVKIKRGFAEDPDQEFRTEFQGRVVGTKPGLAWISIQCENEFTTFRRSGGAAVMQRPCRHALYHGGCGLDIADFNTAGTATAYAGSAVTVTEAASQSDGYYNGGILTFSTFPPQMIVAHVGTALTMLGPVGGLAEEIAASTTAAVSIAPGCNRSTGDCFTKFSNIENYGGFPYMMESPFDGRNNF